MGSYSGPGWTAAGYHGFSTNWWPDDGLSMKRGDSWSISIPLWIPTAISVLALLAYQNPWTIGDARTRLPSECRGCGYDIRGSGRKCPGCGRISSKAA